MSYNSCWNYRYEKHVRKTAGGMPANEANAAKEFWSTYLQSARVNPRGVRTDLIPSRLNTDHAQALLEKESALESINE